MSWLKANGNHRKAESINGAERKCVAEMLKAKYWLNISENEISVMKKLMAKIGGVM